MKSRLKYFIAAIGIILVDQICKGNIIRLGENTLGIKNFFEISNFTYGTATYVLGVDSIFLLLGINILIISILLRVLIKYYRNMPDAVAFGIILLLAGEFSNMFDRILRGYIVKYLSIFNSTPFNIAHIGMMIGIIIIVATSLITIIQNQEK